MDAEQVVEKILGDARGEAGKITAEAEKQAAEASAKLNAEVAEFEKETLGIAESKGADKKSRILARARMEISREVLAEKRVILDDVFAAVADKLRDMPAEEYRGLMGKLLVKVVESGDEEVIVDANDSRLDDSFLSGLNECLAGESKGNLKFAAAKADLGGGGFILSKGKIKINVSLTVLVEQLREKLETKLAKELF